MPLRLADSLCSVIFPTDCSICGAEVVRFDGLGVCERCWLAIEPWTGEVCARCGIPIVSSHENTYTLLCGNCQASEPPFDQARAYSLHKGALRLLILQLKFHRRERLGTRLGRFLAGPWEQIELDSTGGNLLIVPVPLFRSRERERGFNQSLLLARGLARELRKRAKARRAQLAPGVLVRTRPTRPQTSLKFAARLENVRGAFGVRRPDQVKGRDAVLIDDVATTGATLTACAGALRKAGARQIFALTLARATPQFPDLHDRLGGDNIDELRRDWT